MLSDEMAAQMSAYDSMYRVQTIDDPDLADMSQVDTATEVGDDTVIVDRPIVDSTRVRKPVQPPVVQPPVVQPPVPRDTVEDSVATGDSTSLRAQQLPDPFVLRSKNPDGEAANLFFLRQVELGLERAHVLEKEPFVDPSDGVRGERDLLNGIPLNLRAVSLRMTGAP